MLLDRVVAVRYVDGFALFGLSKCIFTVATTPDGLGKWDIFLGAWPSQVTDFNTACSDGIDLAVQLLAVMTGRIGEDIDVGFFVALSGEDNLLRLRDLG